MNPRIRITLNKGRHGIPIEKLASISKETAKFLASLGQDLGSGGSNQWIAENFRNSSVIFDLKDPSIPDVESDHWRRAFRAIMAEDLSDGEINLKIQRKTRHQYAAISSTIDPDEVIEFGIYRNGGDEIADTFTLSRQHLTEIEAKPSEYRYHGEVQGVERR